MSFSLAALTPHALLPDLSRHSMSPLPPSSVSCRPQLFNFSISKSLISSSNLVFLQSPCDFLYLTLPADPDDTTTPHHMLPVFFYHHALVRFVCPRNQSLCTIVKDTCLPALRPAPFLRLFFAIVQSVVVTWIVKRKEVHHRLHPAASALCRTNTHINSIEPLLSGGTSHFRRL